MTNERPVGAPDSGWSPTWPLADPDKVARSAPGRPHCDGIGGMSCRLSPPGRVAGMTIRRIFDWGIVFALIAALAPRRADAQGPTVDQPDAARVRESTSLGAVPGSGGTRGGAPSDIGTILGGRPGPSVPRAPTAISTP